MHTYIHQINTLNIRGKGCRFHRLNTCDIYLANYHQVSFSCHNQRTPKIVVAPIFWFSSSTTLETKDKEKLPQQHHHQSSSSTTTYSNKQRKYFGKEKREEKRVHKSKSTYTLIMKFLSTVPLLVMISQQESSTSPMATAFQPISQQAVTTKGGSSLLFSDTEKYFQVQKEKKNHCWILHSTTSASDVSTDNNDDDDDTDTATTKAQASLTFAGKTQTQSNKLPSIPKEKIVEFFKVEENRNLLITAGGKRGCEPVELTSEYLQIWKDICTDANLPLPDENSPNDVAIAVSTGGINFPGLEVKSDVVVGMKLVENPNAEYHTTVLGEEKSVSGLPPVVWIYNKLMGGPDAKGTIPKSMTIISYEQTENWETIFKCQTDISITITFPKVLMKIIPSGKEKAEENGSKAILKTVEKDIVASMVAFEKAYMEWIK